MTTKGLTKTTMCKARLPMGLTGHSELALTTDGLAQTTHGVKGDYKWVSYRLHLAGDQGTIQSDQPGPKSCALPSTGLPCTEPALKWVP